MRLPWLAYGSVSIRIGSSDPFALSSQFERSIRELDLGETDA
ncbi:MAG: hypothetical protein AABZ47_18870 [Planctomycetota bacterium]